MTGPTSIVSENHGSAGPLAGVVVLEFGQFVAVPFCSQLLAMCGARILKVEPLLGDPYRRIAPGIRNDDAYQFVLKNRGKESIAIDLSAESAPEVVRRLVEMSDMILVNMSPDAVERHGLDYNTLRDYNPAAIYGGVSAFGGGGPESELPGMDAVVQARSGLLTSLGAVHAGLPFHSEVQVADYSAALLLFGALLAAYTHRLRTGVGQEVEVSLLAGALAIQNNVLGSFPPETDWRSEFRDVLATSRDEGWHPSKVEVTREALRPAAKDSRYYGVFRTNDIPIAVGAGSPATLARLRSSVSKYAGVAVPDDFSVTLRKVLLRESADYWIDRFRTNGIPVSKVKHVDEMHDDEHVRAVGLVALCEHPRLGSFTALGPPMLLKGSPLRQLADSPLLGQNTTPILGDAGFTASEISDLLRRGVVTHLPPEVSLHVAHAPIQGTD